MKRQIWIQEDVYKILEEIAKRQKELVETVAARLIEECLKKLEAEKRV